MDLHELGAGAYPDFMSHSEDPWIALMGARYQQQ